MQRGNSACWETYRGHVQAISFRYHVQELEVLLVLHRDREKTETDNITLIEKSEYKYEYVNG